MVDSIPAPLLTAVRCSPMRRLARHLFTLCAAVSLLLCVAVLVAWARSGGATHEFVAARAGASLWVFASTTDGVVFKRVWPWPYDELGRRPAGVRGTLSSEESFSPGALGYREWASGTTAWARGRVMVLEWPDGRPCSVADYWDDYQELAFDAAKPGAELLSLRVRHWLLACVFGLWPFAWLVRQCVN